MYLCYIAWAVTILSDMISFHRWQNDFTNHDDLLVSRALVCMHVCTHNAHIHTKHVVESSFFLCFPRAFESLTCM